MTNEEIKNKIETLMREEAFSAKLKACESAQEVSDLFAAEGIEVSAEDLEAGVAAMEANGGEFSEEELDNVAGGVAGTTFLVGCILFSAAELAGAYYCAKWRRRR